MSLYMVQRFETLGRKQTNTLLATEIDFWRWSARKSKEEKIRNQKKEIMYAKHVVT
jgi:hypothetical protein